jgi:hypothetical protein
MCFAKAMAFRGAIAMLAFVGQYCSACFRLEHSLSLGHVSTKSSADHEQRSDAVLPRGALIAVLPQLIKRLEYPFAIGFDQGPRSGRRRVQQCVV